MYFTTHQTFHSFVGRWRHTNRKFVVEIFLNVKSVAELVFLVTIGIILLTPLTYVSIYASLCPADMHCPTWDDTFDF